MATVLKNVFNIWTIHEKNLSIDGAIESCSDLIGATHGGEAYVVPDQEVSNLEGESTTEARPRRWYDVDGKLHTGNFPRG